MRVFGADHALHRPCGDERRQILTPSELEAAYARVLAQLDPDARLERSWPLQGGISAATIALDYRDHENVARRLIVRRIGARTEASDRLGAFDQFTLLRLLHEQGLPVPEPLLLDESCRLLPEPYLMLGYLDGAPDHAPADPLAFARSLAHQLADIHRRTRALAAACSFVPRALASLQATLADPPFACAATYPQSAIRELLAARPLAQHNPDCVLHGDFHAGNLLWSAGALTGVLDWADALVGDPLADVATTRLDLQWMLDDAAVDAFTAQYLAEADCDLAGLPYWDLFATLRPGSHLAAWASVWPSQGRPEITERTMSEARDRFARRALEALNL